MGSVVRIGRLPRHALASGYAHRRPRHASGDGRKPQAQYKGSEKFFPQTRRVKRLTCDRLGRCDLYGESMIRLAPSSFRQWGRRRTCRALCRTMLRQLALVETVNHIDRCRTCREEIAKRRGLGWHMACALIRSEGENNIRNLPVTEY